MMVHAWARTQVIKTINSNWPTITITGETNRHFKAAHLRVKDDSMRTLLTSSTVFLTILLSFAFGISFGYLVIASILRGFAYKPEPKPAPARAAIAGSGSAQ
jgi:hypothetical protein